MNRLQVLTGSRSLLYATDLTSRWVRGEGGTVPHSTNRAAFHQCDRSEPLLQLYTTLIAVELALKDHSTAWTSGHDLQVLITPLLGATASTLQSVLTTLEQSLRQLRCTTKNGTGGTVKPAQYPDLRYLRFAKDGFPDGSPDTLVVQALHDAQQLVAELARAGVHP